MQKLRIILIVSLIINFILGYYIYSILNKAESLNFKEFNRKIDSLEVELSAQSNRGDSIRRAIDTVYIKLKDNNLEYEKAYNTINNNTINEDYIFFINYLSRNKSRLDSINNF